MVRSIIDGTRGQASSAMKRLVYPSGALCILIALSACGGSKILKEPEPFVAMEPLAAASDQTLSVMLDWVIVRDGPGTWARKADWDEYLLRVRNDSDQPIRVSRLIVIDSLDVPAESQPGRKQLVKSSKKTARRYKKTGIKVKAGSGRGTLGVAAVTAGGAAIGAATATTGGILGGAGWGAIGGATFVLAPVLAVGGVVRGVNQSKVNKQIELRQTAIPLDLAAREEQALDIFFPIAPSPTKVELTYADTSGERRLVIDIRTVLNGLHIETAVE
jgi:hypothetical protein